jgi:hypothetical protein
MRLFERLRVQLGFQPSEPQIDSKKTRDGRDTAPYSAVEVESMCCGNCSGSTEVYLSELPNGR